MASAAAVAPSSTASDITRDIASTGAAQASAKGTPTGMIGSDAPIAVAAPRPPLKPA